VPTSEPAGPGFQVWLEAGAGVVTVPDELKDSNAQQFWEALAFAAATVAIITVDFSRTRECEPRALVPLLMTLRYTDMAGGEVRVVLGRDPAMRRAFIDSGMHRLFPVYDSVIAALHAELPAAAAVRERARVS
jgi:anti-anti-sigma regulatory factor